MATYLRKYICGKKALDYWNVPNFRGVIEPENAEFPLEHVIFTDRSLYRPQGIMIHTCRIKDAEHYTKKNVCTLPLVFLQVALEYTIHELIYLGLQICSHREKGPPLCSVQDLYNCAKKLKGHRGRQKALRAIRYLDNGSRSPMESILYMFLRLPNALGGCAFTEIRLNQKLTLRKSRNTYYADLYAPSSKLDIEYDSQIHHDNPTAYSSDSIRAAHLEDEGYQILSVKPVQLYNLKYFETLSCSDLLSSIVCELFHILSSCCFKGVFKGFAETVPGIGHSVIRGFSDNHLPQVNGPPRALLSCNANHEVSVSMGLAQMAQTWSVIKTLGNALNIVISFSACSLLVLLLSCLPHVYVIGHHAPDKTG
jgi:very-short-patch-repair endonuclease